MPHANSLVPHYSVNANSHAALFELYNSVGVLVTTYSYSDAGFSITERPSENVSPLSFVLGIHSHARRWNNQVFSLIQPAIGNVVKTTLEIETEPSGANVTCKWKVKPDATMLTLIDASFSPSSEQITFQARPAAVLNPWAFREFVTALSLHSSKCKEVLGVI